MAILQEQVMVLESISRQSSTEATKRNSGYEVLLSEPLPDRLICPLCQKLMRNPIQTYRGELSCEYCYQANQTDVNICPIDNEPISQGGIHRDKFQEQLIQNLPCLCVNKEKGCPWKGIVKNAEIHQESCQFFPGECCFCREETVDRNMTSEHLIQCAALVGRTRCIYESIGCTYKVTCLEDHVHHIVQDNYQHVYLQQQMMEKQKETSISLREESKKKDTELHELKNRYYTKVSSLEEQISELMKGAESMQKQMSNMNNKLVELSTQPSRLQSENISNETSDEYYSAAFADVNAKIYTLDLKQQLTENTTYGGRIMWKIDNVTHRMQQAVTGRVTALHSAPCFTSKYGFKMCGRLYLNGDGMGKCSHVSLFLVLMKSQYDNLLEWPFNKHVMFKLINQEDYSKTIQESFLPDGESSSFKQPTREMNVAAGCPLFISKEKLTSEGFIKDDSLFIEITAK